MPMMPQNLTQRKTAMGPIRIVGQKRNPELSERYRVDRKSTLRSAVAAVEAAVTLPLLVLLVFGSIEIANSIFLAQTLSFASYEGAREAARPGATAAQVNDRVAEIMHARGIQNYNVSITPQLSPTTARGTKMTVRVEAAMSALSSHVTGLTSDRMTAQEVSMVKH
jgi:Flp pilus assembly protein TadG